MAGFVMTPAVEWLEDNMYDNANFDDNHHRGFFSIKGDHECDWGGDGYCGWEEEDSYNMTWVQPGITLDQWMNRSSVWEIEDYQDTLETARQSPFMQSIAQYPST